jgi:uncharacterized protein
VGGGAPADEVLDWGVWMRRFEAGAGFDRMADAGRLRAAHVDRLGDAIARLHAGEPPSPAAFGDPDRLVEVVAANLRELQAQPLAAVGGNRLVESVRSLAVWATARGGALRPLLAARRAGGAVVEGHGDLHLGNVVWHRGRALPFDALEFAPDLRHADRLADLAFPFMDLFDHGRPRLAWRLLARVLDASGDHDGLPLLRWLAAHRALVRAKVALLTAAQGHDAVAQRAAAQRRIALAQALAQSGPAPLVLTCGLSGSGKSTVALRLAEALGALRVRSDVERKRLHGLAPTARVDDPARLYGAEATRRTYDRLLAIARTAIAGGVGVVLDAAYLRRDERRQAQALAEAMGAPFAIVECRAAVEVLRARIRQRRAAGGDPSDADLAVLERQRRWAEPPAADEPVHRLATAGTRAAVARAADAWAARFAARHGLAPDAAPSPATALAPAAGDRSIDGRQAGAAAPADDRAPEPRGDLR